MIVVISLLPFIVGIAFLSRVFSLLWFSWQMKTNGAVAVGRIVAVSQRRYKDNPTFCFPVIVFQTTSGQQFKIEGHSVCGPNDTGKNINVHYVANNPQRAETEETLNTRTKELLTLSGLGIVCLVIGMLPIIFAEFFRSYF